MSAANIFEKIPFRPPAETAERLYVGVLQPRGVSADEARAMFHDHRGEILRAAGADLRGYQTPAEAAGLRAAASACSSSIPTASAIPTRVRLLIEMPKA